MVRAYLTWCKTMSPKDMHLWGIISYPSPSPLHKTMKPPFLSHTPYQFFLFFMSFLSLKTNLSTIDQFCDRFSALSKEVLIFIVSFLHVLEVFCLSLMRMERYTKFLWIHRSSFELYETKFMSILIKAGMISIGKRIWSSELKQYNKLKFIYFFLIG